MSSDFYTGDKPPAERAFGAFSPTDTLGNLAQIEILETVSITGDSTTRYLIENMGFLQHDSAHMFLAALFAHMGVNMPWNDNHTAEGLTRTYWQTHSRSSMVAPTLLTMRQLERTMVDFSERMLGYYFLRTNPDVVDDKMRKRLTHFALGYPAVAKQIYGCCQGGSERLIEYKVNEVTYNLPVTLTKLLNFYEQSDVAKKMYLNEETDRQFPFNFLQIARKLYARLGIKYTSSGIKIGELLEAIDDVREYSSIYGKPYELVQRRLSEMSTVVGAGGDLFYNKVFLDRIRSIR